MRYIKIMFLLLPAVLSAPMITADQRTLGTGTFTPVSPPSIMETRVADGNTIITAMQPFTVVRTLMGTAVLTFHEMIHPNGRRTLSRSGSSLLLIEGRTADQKTPPVLRVDPFIQAIETMKHAVVHVDCLAVTGAQPELVDRVGSAFFISEAGDFLTAAHVIQEVQRRQRCASSAITLPADDWRPEARTENLAWFPFKTPNCKINDVLDIAVCPLNEDLSARKWELHLRAKPVEFEWNIPPDGTPVAFTGFPLRARDPMTFRAAVAAYLIPWSEEAIPELVLDHGSLPGFSGSPVYLADGKIVAVLVKGGKGETDGIALARPASVFREMIGKRPERK